MTDSHLQALIAGIKIIHASAWAVHAFRQSVAQRIRVSPSSGGMCLPEYLQADDQVPLSLRKGQLIEISKRNDDGWWYGALLYEELKEDAKQVEDHIGNAGYKPPPPPQSLLLILLLPCPSGMSFLFCWHQPSC